MERIFSRHLKGNGIEIGALDHPMNVPMGTNVQYVDYLDTNSLRSHYSELKNVEIVNIDVVADIYTLDSAFSANSLDFVILNQIIEHVVDPLGALMKIHAVLRVGGVLHLAVPDRRATFDRDRPRTSLSHLVHDHEVADDSERDKRDIQHYKEWVEKVPQYYPKEQRAYQSSLEQLWQDRYCIHLHVWEPDDWPAIINYLNEVDCPYSLSDYSNVLCPEKRNEFVLMLKKEASPVQPLQDKLSEKGPLQWHISSFCIRVFLRPLRNVLRPIKHFCLRSRENK